MRRECSRLLEVFLGSIFVRHHYRYDWLALVAWADLKLEIVIALPSGSGDDDAENDRRFVDLPFHNFRHPEHVMQYSCIVIAVFAVLDSFFHDSENGRCA